MTEKPKQTYSLWTAITMIVGIVIGSGIYFKADDILRFTGGNVWLGMLVISLGSISIIFGSLAISELAQRQSASGGLSSYYEAYTNEGLAASLGFFSAFLYLPSVLAIVSWVASIYTWVLLGMDVAKVPLETQISLAAIYLILLGLGNIFSRILAGYFQTLATGIKVIPLFLIGLVGLFWAQGQAEIPAGIEIVERTEVGWGWIAGLVPLAYAFEGWVAVASIAPEIKNPKKNLAKAFIIGPLIILGLYLLFFYGMNRILGPEFILSTGDTAITHAGTLLFGPSIGKLLMLVVLISVLGVVNGLLLATIRLPQAFAARGWIRSKKMAERHPKYQVSIPSALLVIGIALLYLALHYLVTTKEWIPGSDISEVAIVFNNLTLVPLYLVVLSLYRKGEIKNTLTGLISPVMAILGALTIFIGSLLNNYKMVLFFQLLCLVFCLVGLACYRRNKGKVAN